MRTSVFVVVAALALATVSAQVGESVQKRFEAGQYDQALQLVSLHREQNALPQAESYLAIQSLMRLGRQDGAKEEAARLSERSDGVWRLIAQSAQALSEGDKDRALAMAEQAAADQAKAEDPGRIGGSDEMFVFYQLGLAKAEREDWEGAAAAFGRAAELNPMFAYAHYQAGLAYSKIRRVDLTGVHFEAFLKLAPGAPERPAVLTIMRTLRGR